jgi:beta-lactamase superfamily II metal-dependent hydrolase
MKVSMRPPVLLACFFGCGLTAVLAQNGDAPKGDRGSATVGTINIERIENLTINIPAGANPAEFVRGGAAATSPTAPARAMPVRRELIGAGAFSGGDFDSPAIGKGLEIFIFNMGQADSMLIVGPKENNTRKTLLVDMGEASSGSENYRIVAARLRQILSTTSPKLDYFVPTHFHADHIGGSGNGIAGLVEIEGVTIGRVIDVSKLAPAVFDPERYMAEQRSTFETYVETMGRISPQFHVAPQFGDSQIKLGGGVNVEILAFAGMVPDGNDQDTAPDSVLEEVKRQFPQRYQDAPASENDLSIAVEISLGNFEMFTAGDLSGTDDEVGHRLFTPRFDGTYTNVETWMVDRWRDASRESDVEIYRANHHGSGFSSTPSLISALDPEFVIYSCGGQHKHPTPSVCNRVATTAWQYVTSKLSRESWPDPDDFARLKGEVLGGELSIHVSNDGNWYLINDELHKAFTNTEEAGGADIDEELMIREPEDD